MLVASLGAACGGCKFRCELATVGLSVAQLREGDLAWDRQAWSVNRLAVDKNRIEGVAKPPPYPDRHATDRHATDRQARIKPQ